jgi:hypothetical protein
MDEELLFRIVDTRADGSKQVLCDKLRSTEAAQQLAGYVLDPGSFGRVTIERDSVAVVESQGNFD